MLASPAWLAGAPAGRSVYAYAGCYTSEQRHAHGDGIHVYRMDPATGVLSQVQQLGSLVNPSFLLASPNQRFLYSVHGDERYASAFSVDPATGRIAFLNKAETGGVNGVHLACSPDGRFLLVANYGSGSVAVLPIEEGRLGDPVQLVTLPGEPGPHRIEQPGSRPHHLVFDDSGRFVYIPDKGLDRVFSFRFDGKTGRLSPTAQGSVQTRPAAGPRHLAIHPKLPVLWVLNELNSTICTYSRDPESGALQPRQILSLLPPEFTGNSTGAEIALSADSRFVYCSNRGHDSITAFHVHPQTGLLTNAGWTPSGGKTPRFIGFDPDGRFLYSANEQGDTITCFRRNSASGKLTAAAPAVQNLSPVTIAFIRL